MSFAPDSAVVADVMPSPNHGERRGVTAPDMLILHYTGMPDADAALERLCAPASEVSAHYLVFENGRVVQCVPEGRRAWHAGASSWDGITDINSHSVGIEIANPGHEHGYVDFPAVQIDAVIALCRDIVARHPIRPARILAHSDVAPARKEDPGEKFPWRTLHEAGIGLWVPPAPLDGTGAAVAPGEGMMRLREGLKGYGYGIDAAATCDPPTEQVVRAFQRHFRPARVDGIADASTVRTLHDLLRARDLAPIV
jgi:N-acetylmuramoyl-L-alanine amidase